MVTYWIAISDETNWEIIKDKNIFGVTERHKKQFKLIQPEDCLIVYVKPKQLGGIFSVKKKFRNPLFRWDGYVNQIKLNPLFIATSPKGLEREFIDSLDLFRNKMWGATLKGKALIKITDNDWKRLITYLK